MCISLHTYDLRNCPVGDKWYLAMLFVMQVSIQHEIPKIASALTKTKFISPFSFLFTLTSAVFVLSSDSQIFILFLLRFLQFSTWWVLRCCTHDHIPVRQQWHVARHCCWRQQCALSSGSDVHIVMANWESGSTNTCVTDIFVASSPWWKMFPQQPGSLMHPNLPIQLQYSSTELATQVLKTGCI